jgi:hypothetical protein
MASLVPVQHLTVVLRRLTWQGVFGCLLPCFPAACTVSRNKHKARATYSCSVFMQWMDMDAHHLSFAAPGNSYLYQKSVMWRVYFGSSCTYFSRALRRLRQQLNQRCLRHELVSPIFLSCLLFLRQSSPSPTGLDSFCFALLCSHN